MSRRRLHPPTWTVAIETVLDIILRFAGSTPITDEQNRVLTEVYLRCDDLRKQRQRHPATTNQEFAEKYRISPRTVSNWRREGCPFAKGQPHVLRWLSHRRYAPAGARAKFKKQLERRKWKAILAEGNALMADARELKLLHKVTGIALPPDDWLRRFRCPKGGVFRANSGNAIFADFLHAEKSASQ